MGLYTGVCKPGYRQNRLVEYTAFRNGCSSTGLDWTDTHGRYGRCSESNPFNRKLTNNESTVLTYFGRFDVLLPCSPSAAMPEVNRLHFMLAEIDVPLRLPKVATSSPPHQT